MKIFNKLFISIFFFKIWNKTISRQETPNSVWGSGRIMYDNVDDVKEDR